MCKTQCSASWMLAKRRCRTQPSCKYICKYIAMPMHDGAMGVIKLTPVAAQASYLSCQCAQFVAQVHAELLDAAQPLQMVCVASKGPSKRASWCVRWTECKTASTPKMQQRACGLQSRARPQSRLLERECACAMLGEAHHQDAERGRLMAMFDINNPHSLQGAQAAVRTGTCSGGVASAYFECCQSPTI